MRFLIVSAVIHKKSENKYGGYTPYVREMNIWFKHVDEVRIIAPLSPESLDPLETLYSHPKLTFVKVPALDFTGVTTAFKSLLALPVILFRIFQGMVWANHIHLRCPANLGLLAAFVQIFFPRKPKTVKYANNWDRASNQAKSYRVQQAILSSEFWTRNTKILVYGDWNEKSRNILPFFTASYSKKMRIPVEVRTISKDTEIRLLFVGTVTPNKRPMIAVKTLETLRERGFGVRLDLIGGGFQTEEIREYIASNKLESCVSILGKMNPDEVIEYFKRSHFLVFMSMSEGWPKVIAEAMWWGCLPVTTDVSCVRQMAGNGSRGVVVKPDSGIVANVIEQLLEAPEQYASICKEAMTWARQYHFERFEEEIVKLLKNEI
ncbi:MAG: glycosyltransferase [Cytophagaceae bacterium]|jgi:glycosyltransferase involved in cell wall biosynthesis|nr:glycosyltransferase [Cytophagaceae bacterium]